MVNTHFAQKIGLLGCMALTALPVWAEAVESEASAEPDTQRSACDARCREDYQSNAAALQACLRDCGAIGPATAGAISADHEATHTVQQAGTTTVPPTAVEATTVKGSKSNSDNRQANPATPPPVPAEASNLNLSKSNINREAETEASGVTPPPPTPVESANLNLSKSNINSVSGEKDPEGSTDPDDQR